MVRTARWCLMVGLSLWLAMRVVAIEASVQVDRDRIEQGESFMLNLIIRGTQSSGRPANLTLPGLSLRYLGPVSQMESVNGQTTVQVLHRFLATPEGTNDVTIPAFQIRVGDQTLTTQPVVVRVLPREEHDEPVWIKLLVDKNEVVVGETFPVEVQLYFQSVRDVSTPRFDLDGFVIGRNADPRQGVAVRGDQQWSVVTWRFAVTASKPGDLKIGPAEIDLTLLMAPTGPRRQGSFMDDFFGPPREAKRITVKSPGHALKVTSPPAMGRLAGYSGAVGQFRMSATVTPAKVNVGDPVTVRVTVQGQGGIDRLELPPWPETPSLRVYPGTNGFAPADDLGLTGTRTLEYVVVPEQPGNVRLPVPPLVYYDPASRRYETASAGPVMLTVQPGTAGGVAPAGGAGSGAANAGTNPAASPKAGAPVLAWRPMRSGGGWSLGSWAASPWVGVVALLPWCVWAGAAAVRIWRQRLASRPPPPAREGWKTEAQRLRARVESGSAGPEECARAVRCWIGSHLDRNPDAVTSGVVAQELRPAGVSTETCDALERWFNAYEAMRFAPAGGGGSEGFRQETARVLGLLAGVGRNS